MYDLSVILLVLCVVVSAIKLSVMSFSKSLIVAVVWLILLIVAAPFIAQKNPVTIESLGGCGLWHQLLWIEGVLMITYCLGFPSSSWAYRLLSWFPGIMCGVSFYFMLTYSFIKFIDCNFAFCGVIVGLVAALALLIPSVVLRNLVNIKAMIVNLIFALEIVMLLLTAL